MKHMTIMLAAAMAVSGCTRTVKFDARGNAEPGSERPGMATIVVSQRQADGFGTAWWQNVEIDDKKVGDIRRGTYVHVNVIPGHHTVAVAYPPLTMMTPPLGLESDFEADKTYYFIWNSTINPMYETIRLIAVSPSEGRASLVGFRDRTVNDKAAR